MQSETSDKQASTPTWQYTPDEANAGTDTSATHAPLPPIKPVQWTASEFIDHQKSTGWYLLLMAAGIGIAAVIYLVSRDLITAISTVVVFGLFAVFASRKPRTLQYEVNEAGIHIGNKKYSYAEFRSFSVRDEGAVQSLTLMPLKRFMPPISLYYAEKDEDSILDVIGSYIPFQENQNDPIDNLMRRIRF